MAVSVEQFLTQMAGPRHMCFGLEGLPCGPGRLVSPDGASELPGCGCQGTMNPLLHGPQVLMKWTKGEDTKLQGSLSGADLPQTQPGGLSTGTT